ncbi:WD repeat-containing protein 3 [Phlebotomus argentipes]|uniref:WD repeat-containing protein 3 n=1 Tax=Phlebotomus argentipes TaxID=94469 RepID=UPI00289364BE|nr:WD repeat-containing protein 3 [Phlebotomus argentipes]
MGITKQYLAFKPAGAFNIIASSRPNTSFVTFKGVQGRCVAVGGAEKLLIWDLRIGEKVLEITNEKHEVTVLRPSPDNLHIAVGYADGSVQIFEMDSRQSVGSFVVHRSAVSCLRYDTTGMKLLTGGLDTDLVVLDIVAEAGLCRLSGHRGPISDAHFLDASGRIVVSCSKDTHIKFWDIETQNCFKTLVDHTTEVWGLAILRGGFLISGSSEPTLNVYRVTPNTPEETINESEAMNPIQVKLLGVIPRAGKGRTVTLASDQEGSVLACHGTDNQVELFYFCSPAEALKRLSKRLKKLSMDAGQEKNEVSLFDEVKKLPSIRTQCKIRGLDLLMGVNGELRIVVSSASNFIRLFSVNVKQKNTEAQEIRSLTHIGHHTEIRSVAFSSDSLAIATGSGDTLKVWSQESLKCIRTVETGAILCCLFVPGDRHVLLGLKSGELMIVNIVVGTIVETIPAHEKELWSICSMPDLKGCVSAGGDKTVKMWSYELIQDPESKSQVLSLMHRNTLKLEEAIMCVRISPDNKFIACALLDSTVKIFFRDTLKFYLSLYGHKLPVTSMDISHDSSLIVTGSGDRNVKVWGMDFGDCHKSLFAHDDSVLAVQFIPQTHMFFSCGKDGKIKEWDADTFERISTLSGHHVGEANALAVSPNGMFVVTAGTDRVVRLFEKTDEPIVLEDAQEEEREEIENRILATGDESTVPGMPGLKLPSKKTVGAEKGAESILECLEIGGQFDVSEDKELHPLMKAFDVATSSDFLLVTLSHIRPSDLEESLLLLPFTSVCDIIRRIHVLAEKRRDQTELICKVVLFLFRIHQKPIVANHVLYRDIKKMIRKLQEVVQELRDMIGMNYYGLRMMQRQIEESEGVELFKEITKKRQEKDKRRKADMIRKRARNPEEV